jgi:hypothetical protein
MILTELGTPNASFERAIIRAISALPAEKRKGLSPSQLYANARATNTIEHHPHHLMIHCGMGIRVKVER